MTMPLLDFFLNDYDLPDVISRIIPAVYHPNTVFVEAKLPFWQFAALITARVCKKMKQTLDSSPKIRAGRACQFGIQEIPFTASFEKRGGEYLQKNQLITV
jgi:hypothetical protein